MKITIELNADQEYSVRELWQAQRKNEVNAQGQSVLVRIYSSPEEFCADILDKTIIQQALRDFPPPSLISALEQKRVAEEQIVAASKSQVVMPAIER
jgi:hypothetical protein